MTEPTGKNVYLSCTEDLIGCREDLKKHLPRNKSDFEGAMEFAKKKGAFKLRKGEKTMYWVRLEQMVITQRRWE